MQSKLFSSPDWYRVQKTIKSSIHFKGIGLHTGVCSELKLIPSEPSTGIHFEKILKRGKSVIIPAHFNHVVATSLATSIGIAGQPDTQINTVEHLLSALYALGITNVKLQIEGPEIPILDGSAYPFLEAIKETGIELQNQSSAILKILKPIKIYKDGAICELLPREGLRLTTSVDFPHPMIGLQSFALELTPDSFLKEISKARTFGFYADLHRLQSKNLALGASLDNVLGFSEEGILNKEGMRYADECVRHKLLDALGDLALCGSWIEGEMVSFRGGHSIHRSLLETLVEQPSHWQMIPAEPLLLPKTVSTSVFQTASVT